MDRGLISRESVRSEQNECVYSSMSIQNGEEEEERYGIYLLGDI